ncbi:MAG: hypothetical protein OEW96_10105 [Betaproteobacteria bacterium]|nr:hypothetical protein [Betaproteobacteria bacterium]MDH5212010.1 hypothetical protein [Betaproteobacteria bacterium]
MWRTSAVAVLACGSLLVNSGCAINRATASVTPGADIAAARTFYVAQTPEDERGIEKLIRDNLVKRGYKANAGPATANPPAADVVVTYVDRWMWDITMYMLELTVTFRNPTNSFPMAVGNSYHTSLSRLSPEQMVDEVLGNIFNKVKETGK